MRIFLGALLGLRDAGQAQQATVTIQARRLAFWNVSKNGWDVSRGDYGVYVGASSRDSRLTTRLHVDPI